MAKRRGRSGGLGGGITRPYLKQLINSCGKDLTTPEDIVDDLRSRYPDCAQVPRQRLLQEVRQVLNARINKRVKDEDDDYQNSDEESAVRRKKQRRVDEREEKLKRASPSCLSEDTADVSTSEDAVYSEKLSPRFDFLHDSLRDNYAKMNTSSKKAIESPSPVEKNVEVETVTNKARSKMATMGSKKEAKGSLFVSETTGNGGLDTDKGPTFNDFGGIKKVLDDLEFNVLFPILNPEPFRMVGVKPVSGILFHGPPGCGKTKLANAIANEVGVPFFKISATDIVSGVSGASEENLRELFSKACRSAPSIVFIDEIDAIASKRENQQREMEKRIVTQLLTCMDGADSVLVIGSTNRPDALDPALRRPGRFECEIALGVPDEEARAEILAVVAQKLRLEGPFDRTRIARITPGFVGADLHGVANMAGKIAVKRIFDSIKSELSKDGEDDKSWLRQPWPSEKLHKLFATMTDIEEAVKVVQPSSTREGFSTVPDAKWDNVGGLDHLRQEFNRHIIKRIKSPEIYKAFGLDLETGFLLYGPPGCGKTLIAKAVANEAGANFIHIKGPELLNKYVGESERAIRTLFQRARTCSPCILFFDEVDALTRSRGKEGAWVVEGLLNQFLAELDGGERRNVYVIGATNRPDVVDPAFMRPGRFGNLLYVPLPNADERVSILKALAKKKPIDSTVDLACIAKMSNCENFSGADLAALVHEATLQAVDEIPSSEDVSDSTKRTIKMRHFEQALPKLSPSVSKQQRKHYEDLSRKLQGSMGRNIEQITTASGTFRGTSSQSQDPHEVAELRNELSTTKSELSTTRTELSTTKQELGSFKRCFSEMFGYLSSQDPRVAEIFERHMPHVDVGSSEPVGTSS